MLSGMLAREPGLVPALGVLAAPPPLQSDLSSLAAVDASAALSSSANSLVGGTVLQSSELVVTGTAVTQPTATTIFSLPLAKPVGTGANDTLPPALGLPPGELPPNVLPPISGKPSGNPDPLPPVLGGPVSNPKPDPLPPVLGGPVSDPNPDPLPPVLGGSVSNPKPDPLPPVTGKPSGGHDANPLPPVTGKSSGDHGPDPLPPILEKPSGDHDPDRLPPVLGKPSGDHDPEPLPLPPTAAAQSSEESHTSVITSSAEKPDAADNTATPISYRVYVSLPGAKAGSPSSILSDATQGPEDLKSDPIATDGLTSGHSTASAKVVKDTHTDAQSSSPTESVGSGGTVLRAASEHSSGVELGRSDRTEASSATVKDSAPDSTGTAPGHVSDVLAMRFFRGSDPGLGGTLWQDDQADIGSGSVNGLNSGDTHVVPGDSNTGSGTLFMTAMGLPQSWDLQRSDGIEDRGVTVLDSSSASNDSSVASVADDNGPLWGFLFSRALLRSPGPKKHQATIMIVEGDEATRDAMTVFFVRAGYLVLPAATARDALSVLRTPLAPIDVVLMDMQLPDVNGIHLYQRLRELYPRLPVMVASEEAEPAEMDQLFKLGVQYHFRKPIVFEDLLVAVQAILGCGPGELVAR